MRRRNVIIASTAGAALFGGVFLAPGAQAEPSLCLDVSISIQDQGGEQSLCLPPDGDAPPEVPGLPGLPE